MNRTCHLHETYECTEASGQYRITDKHTLSGQMTGTAELNELLQCQLMFTREHNTSLRKEETSKTKRKVGAGENRKARFPTDHTHREQKAAQTQQKHFKEKTTNFFASIARLEGVWKIRSWHHRFALSKNQGIDFTAAEDVQDGGAWRSERP